ncbi:MAG TPA: inositol monophosphatase family protein [Trueperaceae bacterium]
MPDLRDQLDFAIATAQEAGRLTLGYFQADLATEFKEDLSPVTIADRKAEERIRLRIESRYPGHGMVGEEFGESSAGASHRWLIDPIDGTRAFVRGVPLYAVLLALEVDGRVEVGVADFPALGETLWAARGEGCYWNGRRCRVRDTGSLRESVVAFTGAASFARHGREEVWQRFQRLTSYQAGWSDAYGHALVASGRLELMLDPVMNPWDCGPFPVLLEEAGGYFGNWSGERTIYGGEALSTTSLLLAEVLAQIDEASQAQG